MSVFVLCPFLIRLAKGRWGVGSVLLGLGRAAELETPVEVVIMVRQSIHSTAALLSTIIGSVEKTSFCACDLYIMKVDNECYCNRQQYIRRWECG